MKKLKLLAIIPVMCLSSCSKSDMYGVYEFRLGKTDGSHFGVSVELLKDEAKDAKHTHEGFQKMNLIADFGSEFNAEEMVNKYAENIPYIKDFPFLVELVAKSVNNLIPDDGKLPGYYKKTSYTNAEYGTRIQIGTDYFSDRIEDEIRALADESGTEITDEQIESMVTLVDSYINPNSIEKIFCAYLNDTSFTLQIPVSLDDIKQELAWNGIFLKTTPESALGIVPEKFELKDLPGPKGDARYGVHPEVTTDDKGKVLKDEVAEMNNKYKYLFSNTYLFDDSNKYIGTFVSETVDNKQVLYYSPRETTTAKEVTGKITVTDSFLGIKTKEDFHFKVDDNNKVLVTYKDIKVDDNTEEGFVDLDDKEFIFKNIMVKPFIFRDYHDVKVGLQKAS